MLYAAYGSNLHPLRLQRRAPSATLLGTSFVAQMDICFHKKSVDASGKCNLHRTGTGAFVAIYDLCDSDKAALDLIEGVGEGYEPGFIQVAGYGVCATYFAAQTHINDLLKPYDWYRELVLLGARAQRFPEEYVTRIASQPAMEDPDPGRCRKNWQLVGALRSSTVA